MASFQIGGVSLYGDVDTWVNSQNKSGNYSNVTVRLNIRSTGTSVSSSGNAQLRVNGGQVDSTSWGSYGFNISSGQTVTVLTWTGNIGHDTNGNLSYSIGGSASFSYPGSGSGNWGGYTASRIALAPTISVSTADQINDTTVRLGTEISSNGHGTSSSARFNYKLSTAGTYGQTSSQSNVSGYNYFPLTGLYTNSSYSYYATWWNNNGDTSNAGVNTFKTLASGTVSSPTISYDKFSVTATISASQTSETNPTSKIQYRKTGDTTWLDSTTDTTLTPSITVTGIRPNTNYEYRLACTNSTGTWYGTTRTLKTLNPPGFVFILEEY